MSPPSTPFKSIEQNQMSPAILPSSVRSGVGFNFLMSPPTSPPVPSTSETEKDTDGTKKLASLRGSELSTASPPYSEKPSRSRPIFAAATTASSGTSSPISSAISRSPDPPELLPDPFKIVDEFRIWLIKKSASVLHERLHKAFDKIKEGDWTLEHLPTFTKGEWEDMEIKPSTGKTLVLAVPEFYAHRHKKAKGNTQDLILKLIMPKLT